MTKLIYPGGKGRIARPLAELAQTLPHTGYCEPFCGSAAVLLAKPRVRYELINDLDGELVNFFRVLREQPEALSYALWATPYARAEALEAYEHYGQPEDPVERARLFAVAANQLISGVMLQSRSWRLPYKSFRTTQPEYRWAQLPEILLAVAERLRGVYIDCRDALELIPRLNDPEMLLYVDPPYPRETRTNIDYRTDLRDDLHPYLLELLQAHRGPVIVSSKTNPLYEQALAGWKRMELQVPNMGGKSYTEVVWWRKRP